MLSADWSLHITDEFLFKPWRLIILCNLLPGFVGTLMLIPFPESPKFLLSQGNQAGAVKAIDWIAKVNRGIDLRTFLNITGPLHIRSEDDDEESDVKDQDSPHGILSHLVYLCKATAALFRRPYGLKFTVAVLAMCGLFFSSNGMQIWYPEIVNRLSMDGGQMEEEGGNTVCVVLSRSFQMEKQQQMNNGTIMLHDTNSSHLNATTTTTMLSGGMEQVGKCVEMNTIIVIIVIIVTN